MNTVRYRNLSPEEIIVLESHGCRALDWNLLSVSDGFIPNDIRNVNFMGRCYIGAGVVMENISSLTASPATTFANGLRISVLKEDGGLEVVMHDGLTAMEAAFAVQERVVNEQPDIVTSEGNIFDDGSVVKDVRSLTDVHLTTGTSIIGATRLLDVTVNASTESPTLIGDNVILEHVIVSSGSTVADAAQLDNCFVGQGCHLSRMFSATQSLFFANCHFENGEACALFAGPFSVSHHKSTLLIAMQTSFFNAGSGSNQSNHSYKMGPNKYGQLLRGAKLGSSSYIYWPMQIGVFSTVIGHHTCHADLRNLPFSLVAEKDGHTFVIPAQAFRSIGTRRDVEKWPKRDHRTGNKMDIIDYRMFNPFTVQYILRGIELLEHMQETGTHGYNGANVSARHIPSAIKLYREAVILYQAQLLRTEGLCQYEQSQSVTEWADYAGMVTPKGSLLSQQQIQECEFSWAKSVLDFTSPEQILAQAEKIQQEWDFYLQEDAQFDISSCNITL